MARDRNATAAAVLSPPCPHCAGSGTAPPDTLPIVVSLSGPARGNLQRLADASGLDKSTVSRALSGATVPDLRTVVLLAEALGVTESRVIHHPPVWHRLMEDVGDGEQ